MKIRLFVPHLVTGAALCVSSSSILANFFPRVFTTTTSSRTAGVAAASPFGGSGAIELSDNLGQPQLLVQNLDMPLDIAVSDNIIYAVIGNKGIISAFLVTPNTPASALLINSDVATVPKGPPVGIASFGGNVFVANSQTNTIREFTSSGGQPVLSFSQAIRHPTEIAASDGNLFVLNQGTGNVHQYITEYDGSTGRQIDGNLIQGLTGSIQIAVAGTDLFLLHHSPGGASIDVLDLITHHLTQNFITGLPGPTDIAAIDDVDLGFEGLFVTNVPFHSIDVYDGTTGKLVTRIPGLHGNPHGVDVTPAVMGTSVADQSATWMLLLLGVTAALAFSLILRQPRVID